MTRDARRLLVWFTVGAGVLSAPPLLAQGNGGTGIITGRVLDERDQRPIADAQVFTEDRVSGTRTDREGRYRLANVAPGTRTVGVRMIGFAAKSAPVAVTAGQTATLDLMLAQQAANLDVVVTTGQGGEISSRRLATTVDVVSSAAIERSPANRLDELLQTALPGAQIRMTSGQTGTTSIIRTRGINSANKNSTPVIYVDGVRVDNLNTAATQSLNISGARSSGAATSALADLPLENIDRVEFVPGGAATTLYGSDAANGVIQIFTKKGVAGATRGFVESRSGLETPMKQFLHFKRTADLIYRTGYSQEYAGGVEGGVNALSYSLSGNMRKSESHRVFGDNSAFGFRNGLGADLGTKGRYTGSLTYNQSSAPRFRNGNSGGYQSGWFLEGGRSSAFGFDNNIDDLSDADYAKLKAFVTRAEDLQNYNVFARQFQTSHGLTWQAAPSLSLKATFGMQNRFSNEKAITTNQFLIATLSQPAGTTNQGSIQNYDRNFTSWTFDLGGQHRAELGKLSIITALGGQFFRNDDVQVAYTATNVRDGSATLQGAGVTTGVDVAYRLANYGLYAQSNLSWLERYTLEVGVRSDKNTSFGSTVGAQTYPKVGLVYALSSEPWFQEHVSQSLVSDLRLRAAWGQAGTFPTAFAGDRTVALNPLFGQQSATFGNPGNPDLRPERTSTREVGADLGFLQNRLVFGVGHYWARTTDALINAPPAPSTGEPSQLTNVGVIANRGLESRVTVVPVDRSSVRLTLVGAYNTLHNRMIDMRGTPPFAIGGLSAGSSQNIVDEGFPVGYLRGSKGVFDESGRVTFFPNSYLGNPTADKFGSYSATLALGRRLTLAADGDYQFGAQAVSFDRGFRFLYGVKGTEKDVPAAALAQYNNNRAGMWLNMMNVFTENTDYVVLRHLSADYRIPERYMRWRVRDARVQFAVTNPFIWAASSFDPEITLSGATEQGGPAVGGFNYSTESRPRSYLLTLRLGI